MQPLQICIGSTIHRGRESWCLPYAGFFFFKQICFPMSYGKWQIGKNFLFWIKYACVFFQVSFIIFSTIKAVESATPAVCTKNSENIDKPYICVLSQTHVPGQAQFSHFWTVLQNSETKPRSPPNQDECSNRLISYLKSLIVWPFQPLHKNISTFPLPSPSFS